MENENLAMIAICLSVIAIAACIGIGASMYFNEPESVDTSGISDNSLLITSLQNEVDGIQDDVDDISFPFISSSDLEDLEDYADDFYKIDRNADDIDDLEDAVGVLETED